MTDKNFCGVSEREKVPYGMLRFAKIMMGLKRVDLSSHVPVRELDRKVIFYNVHYRNVNVFRTGTRMFSD